MRNKHWKDLSTDLERTITETVLREKPEWRSNNFTKFVYGVVSLQISWKKLKDVVVHSNGSSSEGSRKAQHTCHSLHWISAPHYLDCYCCDFNAYVVIKQFPTVFITSERFLVLFFCSFLLMQLHMECEQHRSAAASRGSQMFESFGIKISSWCHRPDLQSSIRSNLIVYLLKKMDLFIAEKIQTLLYEQKFLSLPFPFKNFWKIHCKPWG